MYAGRSVGGGMPGVWRGIAGHRAQMEPNGIVTHTPGLANPRGPVGAAQDGRQAVRPARP
jgi:hypothetical protein